MSDAVKTQDTADETLRVEVEKIFDEFINPALNAHGGFANVVRVEQGDVYVELGGGCRGCPGARMTMRSGIEAALRERVPGIRRVVDATDHGA